MTKEPTTSAARIAASRRVTRSPVKRLPAKAYRQLTTGRIFANGPSLTNRSTSAMSESGSEADAAAHDFMGFDPRHGQAASRADTRRSHAVADDLLDELAAQPSSGTAGSPWGSRVAAWSHQRCCRLSYLRMDLRAPAAPPHSEHAQHLHPRSRCRDCGNASTGAACARLRWQWRSRRAEQTRDWPDGR
jgi:hypothetical protein